MSMMNIMQVLLVEGTDDQHVLWALLKRADFPETFKIEQKGGIDNLLKVLPVQLKGSSILTIGVLVDADVNAQSRWNALRAIMVRSGYSSIPIIPQKGGTIIQEPRLPKVGVWIMPDNKTNGMLEDFVADLVPKDDMSFAHAKKVLGSLPDEVKKFSTIHLSKAVVHTWLAWQEDPGTPMGQALTKKYLDASAPITTDFLKWLRRLFIPSSS